MHVSCASQGRVADTRSIRTTPVSCTSVTCRRLFSPALLVSLCLLCLLASCCPATSARQQHNVWYNGLQVMGIAVDEQTGDVFFSDAAANRVVHQTRNASVVYVYNDSGLFSPMTLAYSGGVLYVALSSDNRLAAIDVRRQQLSYSSRSPRLSSCNALAVNTATGDIVALDGWDKQLQLWAPNSDRWTAWASAPSISAEYLTTVGVPPTSGPIEVKLPDPVWWRWWSVTLDYTARDSEPALHVAGNSVAGIYGSGPKSSKKAPSLPCRSASPLMVAAYNAASPVSLTSCVCVVPPASALRSTRHATARCGQRLAPTSCTRRTRTSR